nr:hypothetical protein [Cohnella cholangitidis]
MLLIPTGRVGEFLIQQPHELVSDRLLQQRVFIRKMRVESSAVNIGSVRNILYRHRRKAFFPHELEKSFLKQPIRSSITSIGYLAIDSHVLSLLIQHLA